MEQLRLPALHNRQVPVRYCGQSAGPIILTSTSAEVAHILRAEPSGVSATSTESTPTRNNSRNNVLISPVFIEFGVRESSKALRQKFRIQDVREGKRRRILKTAFRRRRRRQRRQRQGGRGNEGEGKSAEVRLKASSRGGMGATLRFGGTSSR